MEAFLENVINLLTAISQGQYGDASLDEKLKNTYFNMSAVDKKGSLALLNNILGNSARLSFLVLSYLAHLCKDDLLISNLLRAIDGMNAPICEKIVYYRSVELLIFRECASYSEREVLLQVYKELVNEIMPVVDACKDQPGKKREKPSVLILIQPLLLVSHAPSNILVSLAYYYQKLGYDVEVVSTSYQKCDKELLANTPFAYAMNSLSSESAHIDYEQNGVRLDVYNHMFDRENYANDLKCLCEYAIRLNPDYVLSVGDGNVLADMLSKKMNVVTILTTSSDMPLCNSKYLIDYFHKAGHEINGTVAEKIFYWRWKHFKEYEYKERNEIRREYNLPEDAFVILLAGMRLQAEISDEFVEIVLKPILDSEPETIIAFMGVDALDIPKLDSYFKNGRCRCLGASTNYRADLNLADLHINPERQGAGSGPATSAELGIPVISLPNCDGAHYLSSDMIVDSIEEYAPLVHKYIHDHEFYIERSRAILECAKSRMITQDTMLKQINELSAYLL